MMRFLERIPVYRAVFSAGFVFLRRRDIAPAVPLLFGLWVSCSSTTGLLYAADSGCILVVLTRRSPFWLAVPAVFAAGYFAHASRFTWMFAPAMWAVLLAFLDPRQECQTTLDPFHRTGNQRSFEWISFL
jgi:hypothetical protein